VSVEVSQRVTNSRFVKSTDDVRPADMINWNSSHSNSCVVLTSPASISAESSQHNIQSLPAKSQSHHLVSVILTIVSRSISDATPVPSCRDDARPCPDIGQVHATVHGLLTRCRHRRHRPCTLPGCRSRWAVQVAWSVISLNSSQEGLPSAETEQGGATSAPPCSVYCECRGRRHQAYIFS